MKPGAAFSAAEANSACPLAAKMNTTPISTAAMAKSRNRSASFNTHGHGQREAQKQERLVVGQAQAEQKAATNRSVSFLGRHIHM